jgi:hypothetical protein
MLVGAEARQGHFPENAWMRHVLTLASTSSSGFVASISDFYCDPELHVLHHTLEDSWGFGKITGTAHIPMVGPREIARFLTEGFGRALHFRWLPAVALTST